MKWGIRRYQNKDGTLTPAGKKRQKLQTLKAQKKLNKLSNKTDKARNSYESYERNYKDSDAGAKEALTPTQYARWTTSGARMAQKNRLNGLKKSSEHNKKKTEEYMNKLSENYTLVYDVTTKGYTLKPKTTD